MPASTTYYCCDSNYKNFEDFATSCSSGYYDVRKELYSNVESFAMTNMSEIEANEEESRVTLAKQSSAASSGSFSDRGRILSNSSPQESIKNDLIVCAGCQAPVYDKHYMWVDKRAWHEACVQCSVCGKPLTESCFVKERKLYCQNDYRRLQQCRRCGGTIPCNELMQRVGEHAFHVSCLVCHTCHRLLQSGDEYMMDEKCYQISCKLCHDGNEVMHPPRYYGREDDSASDSEKSDDEVFDQVMLMNSGHMSRFATPSGSQGVGIMRGKNGGKNALTLIMPPGDGKRAKRPRTILTTAQRRKFKASFEVSQKPCRKVRETLAAETGLSPRVVQVWFQNQRAKMKKLARRQTQGDCSGQGSHSGNRPRRKKNTDSDSDDLSSPSSYTSTPTPYQSSLVPDTYRSPSSIHTSPTTSVSEGNPNIPFYVSIPTTHESGDMLHEEDFESNLRSMDSFNGPFVLQAPHSFSASDPTSSVRLESSLQLDIPQHSNDYSNDPTCVMDLGRDSIVSTSPQDSFQHFTTQSINPFASQVPREGNPIDNLMHMENNFFRT